MHRKDPDPPHDDEQREHDSTVDTAANPKDPTKPAPQHNPTGVSHNPAQGGPSIRRNPEAGKKD